MTHMVDARSIDRVQGMDDYDCGLTCSYRDASPIRCVDAGPTLNLYPSEESR